MSYGQRGYVGQSMSERAVQAYENGEKPFSKWSKENILEAISAVYGKHIEGIEEKAEKVSLADLRQEFLRWSSWHHTGKYYNKTEFYEFDDDISLAEVKNFIENYKKTPKQKNEHTVTEKFALVKYNYWTGTRKHPKCNERIAVARWTETDGKPSMAKCQYDIEGYGLSEEKRVSSLTIVRELKRWPHKNEKVWKEVK